MSQAEVRAFRHELKYAISPAQREMLRRKLAAIMEPDCHAPPACSYQVRSLYFDDFRNSALREKLAGVMHRKKYRLRMYDFDDSLIRFERKTKSDQYVRKESVPLQRESAERIIAGEIDSLAGSEDPLLRQFYADSHTGLLKPVVIVDYYREAYTYPYGNVRVTFDTSLSTSLGATHFFNGAPGLLKALEAPGIILEVKYTGIIPQQIRGVLPDTLPLRSAIGKFAICRSQQLEMLGFVVN